MSIPFTDTDRTRIHTIITTAGERIRAQANLIPLREKYENDASSVVTQTDIDTEIFLREQFSKEFPSFGFYSEETYEKSANELDKEFCWVVDPIDGTLNFSRGLPIFGISVALLHKKKSVFGVHFFPRLNDFFWAQAGHGSFLNNRRIFVRQPNLKLLYGACGTSLSVEEEKEFFSLVRTHNLETACNYSTIFNYAYTAAGHYDFALSFGPALWDVAAADILVREAGGLFEYLPFHKKRLQAGHPYHVRAIAGHPDTVNFLRPFMHKIFEKDAQK